MITKPLLLFPRFCISNLFRTCARFIAIIFYGTMALQLHSQPSSFTDSKFWLTDGPVNAILATNGTVYIGGDFSYVGPRTGPLALFNQSNGGLQIVPPQIAG